MSSLMPSLRSLESFGTTKSIEISQSFSAAFFSVHSVLTLWSHTPVHSRSHRSTLGPTVQQAPTIHEKWKRDAVICVWKHTTKILFHVENVHKTMEKMVVYAPCVQTHLMRLRVSPFNLARLLELRSRFLLIWVIPCHSQMVNGFFPTEPLYNSQPDWLLISFVVPWLSQASYLHAQTDCAEERPVAI